MVPPQHSAMNGQSYPKPTGNQTPKCHQYSITPINDHYAAPLMYRPNNTYSHTISAKLKREITTCNKVGSYKTRTDIRKMYS